MQAKIDQYKIFKAVADAGNISVAASNMYISQSAVSQSIKSLESALEVRLFSRSRKGVTLTGDGETLYEYVSAALALLESGESKLGESKTLKSGELVIGASNTLTDYYLLPFLHEYHRLYPGVKVRILNGTSKRVMSYLDTGLVDIAFATTNEKPEGYTSYLCFKTHTAFVAAPDYPIDFNASYSLADIAALPLILLEKESGSRRFLEDCFLKEGVRLAPEIELASYELLISLSRIGLGIAGITEELSLDAIDSGQVRKLTLSTPIPTRAVSMLTPGSTDVSMAARKFMELIRH
ncbi:MAG: LysR family transcriptional regulator [Lachnospiraceae bacterium]|nr:LysR family transcriptional regulator [Candidatus Colinaster equi]